MVCLKKIFSIIKYYGILLQVHFHRLMIFSANRDEAITGPNFTKHAWLVHLVVLMLSIAMGAESEPTARDAG